MKQKIIVATGNNNKLHEIRTILSDCRYLLVSMKDFWGSIPVIEENGSTFFENACIKADWVYYKSACWALADDSGLVVDALNGAPGVKSARYAGEHGGTEENRKKLLLALKGVPEQDRLARFVCSAVIRIDKETVLHVEETCEGRIIDYMRGNGGFGYDPLFIPDGFDRTFAELSDEEKNVISHRGKAIQKLKEVLYDHDTP